MVNKKIYYVCLVHLLVLERQALYFIIYYLICENTIKVLQNQEVMYKILFYIFFSGLFLSEFKFKLEINLN